MVKTSQSIEEIKEESEQLRKEIKELKAEALRRLTALEESLGVSSNTNVEKEQAITSLRVADAIEDEGLLPAPPPIVIKSSDSKKRKGVGDLLDETVWKVSLSIGREPGNSS
jgi:Mg2+ and Co2+ transporter CorA